METELIIQTMIWISGVALYARVLMRGMKKSPKENGKANLGAPTETTI